MAYANCLRDAWLDGISWGENLSSQSAGEIFARESLQLRSDTEGKLEFEWKGSHPGSSIVGFVRL